MSMLVHEYVANANVANGMPYEHGPVRMPAIKAFIDTLTVKLSLSGRQHCHMFELQVPLDHWHRLIQYLQVSILVCKYDGHEQHSLGSTSRA